VADEDRGEKFRKEDTVPPGFDGRLRGPAVDVYRSGKSVLLTIAPARCIGSRQNHWMRHCATCGSVTPICRLWRPAVRA